VTSNDFLAALVRKPWPAGTAVATAPHRRRKLWQLSGRYHCALVGSCLPVAVMRKLALRAGIDPRTLSDYRLHATVVAQCDARSGLTESIQRYFDKRFAPALLRFSPAGTADAVATLWREALAFGDDIPGALWAAWTHPATDEATAEVIFGDIHMFSHQIGASARCDLEQLAHTRAQCKSLQATNEALRRAIAVRDRAHDKALAELRRQLDEARRQAALAARQAADAAAASTSAARAETLEKRAAALARRAEALEDRNAENARRVAGLENEIGELRGELAAAEAALASALGACDGVSGEAGCGKTCPAEQALRGRCVLCVGGRTGLVDAYRRVVELQGGRFVHHDGGVEESLSRIDAAIAGADAIVCQAGCVSHAAYWRLKDACKKLGKPCVFVKSPGLASFARGLVALNGAGTEDAPAPLMLAAPTARPVN
jgi:hypothetical protein